MLRLFLLLLLLLFLLLFSSGNKISLLPRSEGSRTPKITFLDENLALHFHITHNTLYLSPKIFCVSIVSNFSFDDCMSQEKLKTMLTQNVWGKTKCIMGNVETANLKFLVVRHTTCHMNSNIVRRVAGTCPFKLWLSHRVNFSRHLSLGLTCAFVCANL